MKALYNRYKQTIMYLFFGICTTVVNIISYYVCTRCFGLSTTISTAIAWVLAVIFAYITNKQFVFESRSWSRDILVKELASFFLCRAATGILDIIIMYVGVDLAGLNDVAIKMLSNVIVIILNYVASKIMIFKKNTAK